MAVYKKRPEEIEAFRYDGDGITMESFAQLPEWFKNARRTGNAYFKDADDSSCAMFIKTPDGDIRVLAGDYVIRGIAGELYSCKADTFSKTYEFAR